MRKQKGPEERKVPHRRAERSGHRRGGGKEKQGWEGRQEQRENGPSNSSSKDS